MERWLSATALLVFAASIVNVVAGGNYGPVIVCGAAVLFFVVILWRRGEPDR
jgi:K+ transporter